MIPSQRLDSSTEERAQLGPSSRPGARGICDQDDRGARHRDARLEAVGRHSHETLGAFARGCYSVLRQAIASTRRLRGAEHGTRLSDVQFYIDMPPLCMEPGSATCYCILICNVRLSNVRLGIFCSVSSAQQCSTRPIRSMGTTLNRRATRPRKTTRTAGSKIRRRKS